MIAELLDFANYWDVFSIFEIKRMDPGSLHIELTSGAGVIALKPYGSEGDFPMFRLVRAPTAAMASLGVALVAALIGSSAIFLSRILEVNAAMQTYVAVHQIKSNRLVIPKGAACSALGWPYYEQSCQFDMRRPADDVRTIRIIALP
jgi:hypothetical protein